MDTLLVIAIIAGVLLVLAISGLVGASIYFYNFAVKRNINPISLIDRPKAADSGAAAAAAEFKAQGNAWFAAHDIENWTITSGDGLKLTGYYIAARHPTAKTAIVSHGYKSMARDMFVYADYFYEKMGYNVLLPDARGHGASEGGYFGFGWPERKDYGQWIGKVIDRVGDNAQIALFGISMGGATVMMVSGEELPAQVRLVIEDCGYTSVVDELTYKLRQLFGIPAFPLVNTTSWLTERIAGFNFTEASALDQVRKSKLPTLFIHGGQDTFVPTEMVYRVYEACQAEKEILVVEGAGHGQSHMTAPAVYEAKVSGFLEKHINDIELQVTEQ